jgi:hypothetical protein
MKPYETVYRRIPIFQGKRFEPIELSTMFAIDTAAMPPIVGVA